MRGSNESTPLDCSETGADRQFVDLPLFTDLESEEAGARETDKAAKPLESEPEATGPIRSAPQESSPAVATPVVQEPEALELDLEEADVDDEEELEPQPYEGPASLTNRLGAALLDLAVMASAAIALLGGAVLLGAVPAPGDWPAFVLPWFAFSFLYHVVPLGFWGRTPGMASMGITARHLDGGSLSFVQAIYRWLATLGTAALLGLPGLLALTGRSLTDRASESVTVWQGYR